MFLLSYSYLIIQDIISDFYHNKLLQYIHVLFLGTVRSLYGETKANQASLFKYYTMPKDANQYFKPIYTPPIYNETLMLTSMPTICEEACRRQLYFTDDQTLASFSQSLMSVLLTGILFSS